MFLEEILEVSLVRVGRSKGKQKLGSWLVFLGILVFLVI